MENNNLLMIILAFVVGFMLQGMTKNMCGGRLVEGSLFGYGACGVKENQEAACDSAIDCKGDRKCVYPPDQTWPGTCTGKANC